jgi:ferrous iron transport protein B
MRRVTPEQCDVCPINRDAKLIRLGLDVAAFDFVLALAGNPNVGKSTVFNTLTGLRQHTGNWPGKTVVRAEGAFSYASRRYKVVDLPGTYSLLSTSADEEVARDFILFGEPDVTVVVVDATRLERNMNLVLQVLEITDRVVVCLNLMDEARRHGITIDDRALMRELGVPVAPTSARQGEGIPQLLERIHQVATGEFVTQPRRLWTESKKIKDAVDKLAQKLQAEFSNLPNARWVALRLLEGDQRMIDAVKSGELASLAESIRSSRGIKAGMEENHVVAS